MAEVRPIPEGYSSVAPYLTATHREDALPGELRRRAEAAMCSERGGQGG